MAETVLEEGSLLPAGWLLAVFLTSCVAAFALTRRKLSNRSNAPNKSVPQQLRPATGEQQCDDGEGGSSEESEIDGTTEDVGKDGMNEGEEEDDEEKNPEVRFQSSERVSASCYDQEMFDGLSLKQLLSTQLIFADAIASSEGGGYEHRRSLTKRMGLLQRAIRRGATPDQVDSISQSGHFLNDS